MAVLYQDWYRRLASLTDNEANVGAFNDGGYLPIVGHGALDKKIVELYFVPNLFDAKYKDIRPFQLKKRFFGNPCLSRGGIGRYCGIVQAFADERQLPSK